MHRHIVPPDREIPVKFHGQSVQKEYGDNKPKRDLKYFLFCHISIIAQIKNRPIIFLGGDFLIKLNLQTQTTWRIGGEAFLTCATILIFIALITRSEVRWRNRYLEVFSQGVSA